MRNIFFFIILSIAISFIGIRTFALPLSKTANNTFFPKDTITFIKGFFQDEKKLWLSPLKINQAKLGFWIPVIGVTMIAMSHDEQIHTSFMNFKSNSALCAIRGSSPINFRNSSTI